MKTLKTINTLRGRAYDYIIVGAGLSGAVHAHELAKIGKKVLIVEKRDHIGGNCHTVKKDGIMVHQYGSHIFHTNNDDVWKWVNQFTEFNDYKHRVIANTGDEHVMLPFSMVTFMQIFNVSTVEAVEKIINIEVSEWIARNHRCDEEFVPKNFAEQAIVLVGTTVYEKLIKHYTEKQWGRKCTRLPVEIIKRLPKRWNTDTTYFNNAKYQGIPEDGYTNMIENMLTSDNIDIIYTDFLQHQSDILVCLSKTGQWIYTGAIDELMSYTRGALDYRSLFFSHYHYKLQNYQGTSVVNFTGNNELYTRITEHKHYSMNSEVLNLPTTHFTIEYSIDHQPGINDPYYPINDSVNNEKHAWYVDQFNLKYGEQAILSGRLAMYRYMDMDKTIEEALKSVKSLL